MVAYHGLSEREYDLFDLLFDLQFRPRKKLFKQDSRCMTTSLYDQIFSKSSIQPVGIREGLSTANIKMYNNRTSAGKFQKWTRGLVYFKLETDVYRQPELHQIVNESNLRVRHYCELQDPLSMLEFVLRQNFSVHSSEPKAPALHLREGAGDPPVPPTCYSPIR